MNVIHEFQPSQPSGWDRRRAETGLRILDAAARLVSEEGVEALTMQRLGQQLGYQAGALYRYFPSKEALLSALLVRMVGEVSTVVAQASAGAKAVVGPVPAHTRALLPLVLAARGYLQLSRERPSQMALLVRALAAPRPVVDDASAQALAGQTLALMGEVSALLEAAAAARALAPGESLPRVTLLWAGLQGLVGNPKLLRFELPGLTADALVDGLVRALLLGWGARPRIVDDCFARADAGAKASAHPLRSDALRGAGATASALPLRGDAPRGAHRATAPASDLPSRSDASRGEGLPSSRRAGASSATERVPASRAAAKRASSGARGTVSSARVRTTSVHAGRGKALGSGNPARPPGARGPATNPNLKETP